MLIGRNVWASVLSFCYSSRYHIYTRDRHGQTIPFSPQLGAQQSFVLQFCLWLGLSAVGGQVYISRECHRQPLSAAARGVYLNLSDV